MKQGLRLSELTARVEREAEARRDFYAPTHELRLASNRNGSRLVTATGEYVVKETAHQHLAEWSKIDLRYYQRLRQSEPRLLDQNVNTWLQRGGSQQRLVRTLADDCRAVVSPRYALLDNDRLLRELQPIMDDMGTTVESCDLNEQRIILKLKSERLQGEVQRGDAVQLGLAVSNSEVRAGALSVQPLLFRLVCTNGLILPAADGQGEHRRHLGPNWGRGGETYGEVSESAERTAWERNVWDRVRSGVRKTINADAFRDLLDKLTATTRFQTTLEPAALVHQLGQQYGLTGSVRETVTSHLSGGYSGTLWNLVNAVTRTAQDLGSYDVATSLEELGGRLTNLSPRQWEALTSLN